MPNPCKKSIQCSSYLIFGSLLLSFFLLSCAQSSDSQTSVSGTVKPGGNLSLEIPKALQKIDFTGLIAEVEVSGIGTFSLDVDLDGNGKCGSIGVCGTIPSLPAETFIFTINYFLLDLNGNRVVVATTSTIETISADATTPIVFPALRTPDDDGDGFTNLEEALSGSNPNDRSSIPIPKTYTFDSKFSPGTSSVVTSGQIARQVLIADLNTEIAIGLDTKIINAPTTVDSQAEALAILNQYYTHGTDVLGATPIALKAPPLGTKQATYTDISVGKNLQNKIAGNDPVTDHKDWDAPGNFVGFTAASPDALIQTLLGDIAANTATKATGGTRIDPIDNTKSLMIYQSNDGLDLKQLVQKFLLSAVTFSQATDDYLDDATPGKGILAANVQDGTKPFTKLEHQFDEAFGYFGGARNYNDYADNEIRGKSGRPEFASGYNDTDGDGKIDLFSEFNFGNSTNAAKRDAGSITGTDFTKAIFDAFLNGRNIITKASDPLTAEEMTALKAQRDIIVLNWEKAIAATVVHFINQVVNVDMEVFGTTGYSYANHIKHWGEMKGFALGFQFNPRSPMNSGTRFADFHTKVGEKPVLPNDAGGQAVIDAYKASLLAARDILQTAYAFDATDVAGW